MKRLSMLLLIAMLLPGLIPAPPAVAEDVREDFVADPRLNPYWSYIGNWVWNAGNHRLASPPAGFGTALYENIPGAGERTTYGVLSAWIKILPQTSSNPLRAGVVFGWQGWDKYYAVTLVSGNPGRILLEQPGWRLDRRTVRVLPGRWYRIDVRLLDYPLVQVYMTEKEGSSRLMFSRELDGDLLGRFGLQAQSRAHFEDFILLDAGRRIGRSCEPCHGGVVNGLVRLSAGLDGIHGTADDAPNVISAGTGGIPCANGDTGCYSVWNGTWWDTTQGGSATVQQGGHGDPDGKAAVGCTGCHDISIPLNPATGRPTHRDGVHNSVGDRAAPGNLNANTAHLKAPFIAAPGGNAWDVQLQFDTTCGGNPARDGLDSSCHKANGVRYMSHSPDEIPAPQVVQFGRHLSLADGELVNPSLPIDLYLSTNAPSGPPHYAPCVSCHDPHGSMVLDTRLSRNLSSNTMLRNTWRGSRPELCLRCH